MNAAGAITTLGVKFIPLSINLIVRAARLSFIHLPLSSPYVLSPNLCVLTGACLSPTRGKLPYDMTE